MTGDLAGFWNTAQERLSKKLQQAIYETIILQAKPERLENGKLTICLPFDYMIRRITPSDKLVIESTLSSIIGRPITIDFTAANSIDNFKSTRLAIETQSLMAKRKALLDKSTGDSPKPSTGNGGSTHTSDLDDNSQNLNPNYLFETFIVGESNLMAHAASIAVTKDLAKAYNPLFLYGGVGLGKTHLLHAIGHRVHQELPEKRIRVCSSETYTNELIDAIGDKERTKKFRMKYRHCDVLLIDDIQFLIDKEATQEAFFHTFNVLYEMGKQIVLTSDRHPRELRTLKERLINRFQLGLIVDIQRPSYETRLAILRRKANALGMDVPPEILEHFAEEVQGSIRSLEGCLKSVNNITNSLNRPVTLEDARKISESYSHDKDSKSKPISLKKIIDLICHHYRISYEEIISASRESHVTHPRHIGMFLARTHTSHSFKEIARAFHRKDHATVHHAVKKIVNGINVDAVLAREVNYIEDLLMGKSPIE
jgi:chromosomal replication initiator protein